MGLREWEVMGGHGLGAESAYVGGFLSRQLTSPHVPSNNAATCFGNVPALRQWFSACVSGRGVLLCCQ